MHHNHPTIESIGEDWVSQREWTQWGAPYALVFSQTEHQSHIEALLRGQSRLAAPVELVKQPNPDASVYQARVEGQVVGHLLNPAADFIAHTEDSPEWLGCPGILYRNSVGGTWSCSLWPMDPYLLGWPGLKDTLVQDWSE